MSFMVAVLAIINCNIAHGCCSSSQQFQMSLVADILAVNGLGAVHSCCSMVNDSDVAYGRCSSGQGFRCCS